MISDEPTGTLLTKRHLVSNKDYHDPVHDWGLSWRHTKMLASRLKQWNIVKRGFKTTFGRNIDLNSFEQISKLTMSTTRCCIAQI